MVRFGFLVWFDNAVQRVQQGRAQCMTKFLYFVAVHGLQLGDLEQRRRQQTKRFVIVMVAAKLRLMAQEPQRVLCGEQVHVLSRTCRAS